MLPQEALEEFKQIMKEELDVDLSGMDVQESAERFLRMMKIATSPINCLKKDSQKSEY